MAYANAPFSRAEYERRLGKTRREMERQEIDVLFVTDPSNQAWLTGYDGWSFYVHQGVTLPGDADPVWWGRTQDTNGARRTVWMEDDGRLYGRGARDMKGFIAAAVILAPHFAQTVCDRPLHFALTHDEEVGCIGARALAATLREKSSRPSVAVIGEPTSMRIVEGHKGCYEYTTHFTGQEGHGSDPDRGVNAVEYAVRYVARLLELKETLKARGPAQSRFEPPWTIINTGTLTGGHAHNVIPGKARADWEMRPMQAGDADFVKTDLARYCAEMLLPAMRAVFPEADIVTETIGEVDGLAPADENEAKAILMELTGATGAELVPFGTEAGIFQGFGQVGRDLRTGLHRTGAQTGRVRVTRAALGLPRRAGTPCPEARPLDASRGGFATRVRRGYMSGTGA